ncbi:hypothetical protein HAX54_006597, partial [Datura stramonium]|nr:hypothetical protein [Datura stramonium]
VTAGVVYIASCNLMLTVAYYVLPSLGTHSFFSEYLVVLNDELFTKITITQLKHNRVEDLVQHIVYAQFGQKGEEIDDPSRSFMTATRTTTIIKKVKEITNRNCGIEIVGGRFVGDLDHAKLGKFSLFLKIVDTDLLSEKPYFLSCAVHRILCKEEFKVAKCAGTAPTCTVRAGEFLEHGTYWEKNSRWSTRARYRRKVRSLAQRWHYGVTLRTPLKSLGKPWSRSIPIAQAHRALSRRYEGRATDPSPPPSLYK